MAHILDMIFACCFNVRIPLCLRWGFLFVWEVISKVDSNQFYSRERI